jgi:hypothetical protein
MSFVAASGQRQSSSLGVAERAKMAAGRARERRYQNIVAERNFRRENTTLAPRVINGKQVAPERWGPHRAGYDYMNPTRGASANRTLKAVEARYRKIASGQLPLWGG